MLSNTKISIIMPVRNGADFLNDSITSILQQTFQQYELIIIDDHSTDQSYWIANHYAEIDHRIKVKKLSEKKGVSAARNKGIEESIGEYIVFVDADDILDTGMLQQLLDCSYKHQSDLVICQHFTFDNEEKKIAWVYEQFPSLRRSGEREVRYDFDILQIPYSWAKLFKKELLENIRFPENVIFGEDQAFIIQAFLYAKKIYMHDEPLYFYRSNQQQVTKSTSEDPVKYLENIINVFSLVKNSIYDSNLDIEIKNKLYILYLKSYLFRNLFNFLVTGLLSGSLEKQISVLDLYTDWRRKLEASVELELSYDFLELNRRLQKISVIFGDQFKKYYEQSYFGELKMGSEDTIHGDEFKSQSPKITIQTVAYNAEAYIRQCAESVLKQSFGEFEWFILDNGSTDNTGGILKEYAKKDERIKLFKSEENHIIFNKPLNADFLKAVENIETEYWCVLDSDDFLHLNFLEELYGMGKRYNADISVAGTEKFFEDGRVKEARTCPDFVSYNAKELGRFFPDIYFMFSVEWGKLVKVSVLKELIKFRIEHSKMLKHADDTLFSLELLKFAKTVVGTSKILHQYRIRLDSQYHSHIDESRFTDYVTVYKRNKELLEDWGQLTDQNLNFIGNKLFHSTTVCVDLISETIELTPKEKLVWFQNILNEDTFQEVLSVQKDFRLYFFALLKEKILPIIKQSENEELVSLIPLYLYKLYLAIEIANEQLNNSTITTAFLLYISSQFDLKNKYQFGSFLLHPFLSMIQGDIYKELDQNGLTGDILISDLVLVRDLMNCNYTSFINKESNIEIMEKYEILEKYFSDFGNQSRKKQVQDSNVLLDQFLKQNNYDQVTEILIRNFKLIPLDKNSLVYRTYLLVINNDYLSALITAETLRTVYPDDDETISLVKEVWDINKLQWTE